MSKKAFLLMLTALSISIINHTPAGAENWAARQRAHAEGGVAGDYNTINNNMRNGINNISNQIQTNQASGKLTPQQAQMLRSQLRDLEAQSRSMGSDGIYTTAEVSNWLSQLSDLSSQVNSAINGSPVVVRNNPGAYNRSRHGYDRGNSYNRFANSRYNFRRNYGDNGYSGSEGYANRIGYRDRYSTAPFSDYSSYNEFRRQLWREINDASVPEDRRQAWLSEFRDISSGFAPNQDNWSAYRDDDRLNRLMRLHERVREQTANEGNRPWY